MAISTEDKLEIAIKALERIAKERCIVLNMDDCTKTCGACYSCHARNALAKIEK